MFFSDGASILITCLTTKDRDAIYNKLYSFASGKGVDYDLIQALQSSTNDSYILLEHRRYRLNLCLHFPKPVFLT